LVSAWVAWKTGTLEALRGDDVPTDEIHETNIIDLTVADDAEPTVEHVLDGDDLTVVTEGTRRARERSRRRPWLLLAEVGAVVLAIAVVAFVVVQRHDSGNDRVETAAETDANGDAGTPTIPSTPLTSAPTNHPSALTPNASGAPTANSGAAPVSSAPPQQQVAPPPSTPVSAAVSPPAPPAPIATTPQQPTSPPSVLQWSAAPSALRIRANEVATLVVTVRNPSDGVVTLPVPLSCTPKLDGSGVCPQMTDTVQPHSQRGQMYKVDPEGLAPGNYSLKIEGGLYSVPVTVNPAA
jgi:hypothetical protein